MKPLLLAFFPLLLLFLLVPHAISSRPLPVYSSSSSELISDGVDRFEEENSSNMIRLKGSETEHEVCEQMYGFLPCSKTIPGHVFLILVYEYLLFHGESYVASGGERIFKILGPGVFGASAFQVIGSLPEALILLASGLLNSKEVAQECVLTGVGLLAGSTTLLLTVVWGTCIILGSQNFGSQLNSNSSSSPRSLTKQECLDTYLSKQWPGYGVVTDKGALYTARIMILSVIPLIIIQIPRIFRFSYNAERAFILFTLLVSAVFLFSYFFYQFFQPWIQRRRLLYIKHEHLVVDVLKHVQDRTMGKLLNENGAPNLSTIRRLFEETDRDGDKFISASELKEFLREIRFRKSQADNDNTTAEIMKDFDLDNDDKITMDEFVNGMLKWLDETKGAMNKRYHSVKSLKDLYQVLKPWIQKKREEREVMKHLIPIILDHLKNSTQGSLLKQDGKPDEQAIKRLFQDIDLDKDGYISHSELKDLIDHIKFGVVQYDVDEVASKILEELDISGDQVISEDEFINGLSRWLNMTQTHDSEDDEDDMYKKTWEQTDMLLEEIDKSPLAWLKAIVLVVLGIVLLGLLAEPLINSVRSFSTASKSQSFFIAFIFVPLATNARIAISALKEARRKKLNITSLTLSEIYGTVFMNNVLGLAVLLSLVYFRGLSWNFTAEVLMVLAVSAVMGFLASFTSVFPVWTSFLAYLLYPLSLLLVYFLDDFNWMS